MTCIVPKDARRLELEILTTGSQTPPDRHHSEVHDQKTTLWDRARDVGVADGLDLDSSRDDLVSAVMGAEIPDIVTPGMRP